MPAAEVSDALALSGVAFAVDGAAGASAGARFFAATGFAGALVDGDVVTTGGTGVAFVGGDVWACKVSGTNTPATATPRWALKNFMIFILV